MRFVAKLLVGEEGMPKKIQRIVLLSREKSKPFQHICSSSPRVNSSSGTSDMESTYEVEVEQKVAERKEKKSD